MIGTNLEIFAQQINAGRCRRQNVFLIIHFCCSHNWNRQAGIGLCKLVFLLFMGILRSLACANADTNGVFLMAVILRILVTVCHCI